MSLDKSLFTGDEIHTRDITLGDGSVHPLYFREVPAGEFRRFHLAEASGDEERQVGSMARLIASSLCEPDGSPALTVAKATKLKAHVMASMMTAIMEINGVSGAAKNG